MGRETQELNVVTGAFGYTGKYITRRLILMGKKVKTLTGHPNRQNPFGNQISVAPFHFDNPAELTRNLQGATTLYNTYWVRFPYGQITYDTAVANTKILINAAKEAGVRRIVHVSITNASEESPFPYFRGKGILEKTVIHSNFSYAIIRPTVIFGHEDILINNIAWFLRKLPVFAIPGEGDYRLQPVFVEDVTEIAVNAGQSNDNLVIDAVGPEIFRYEELIRLIAGKVQSKAKIVHLRPGLALFLSKFIGYMVNDVVLTRDEVEGLMGNLLVSKNLPTGKTRLTDWLSQNAGIVGNRYASELARHYR
ncbi:MAG: NAD(P)H-binding protein [Planctomycetes bacterium]|nr:NAD(P)H-binding protein [Planctomycetota bacterium]